MMNESLRKYILYFGRYSEEKGVRTLVRAAQELTEVKFVFAGRGELESLFDGVPNITNVGFKSGEELRELIANALCSILPAEWNENCPLSLQESLVLGVPVIAAKIGGMPELLKDGETGLLFESGNSADLTAKLRSAWENERLVAGLKANCARYAEASDTDGLRGYCEFLREVYTAV